MKQNFEQLALLNFRTREEGKRFICQSLKLEKIIEKHQQKLNQIKQGRLKQNKMQQLQIYEDKERMKLTQLSLQNNIEKKRKIFKKRMSNMFKKY